MRASCFSTRHTVSFVIVAVILIPKPSTFSPSYSLRSSQSEVVEAQDYRGIKSAEEVLMEREAKYLEKIQMKTEKVRGGDQ